MKQVGPVTLDMNNLTLTVYKDHQPITLKANSQPGSSLQVISGATLFILLGQNECGFIGQLKNNPPDSKSTTNVPTEISPLLETCKPVFEEPKGLPPIRPHDHSIPLKPNATPFSIKPYRYPFVQKNAIETIVKKMLEQGIIQERWHLENVH